MAYEVAFVAVAIGSAWAVSGLEFLPSCAYTLGVRPGWRAEWIVILSGGAGFALLATLAPVATAWPRSLPLLAAIVPRALLSSAPIAAVGVLLLRAPLVAGSQALALIVATWIAPAILPASFASVVLGRGPHWSVDVNFTPTALAGRIASLCGLLLCAHLMDAQRRVTS
jgi:hypothetical protein